MHIENCINMNKNILILTTIALLGLGSLKAQDIVNLRMDAAWQGLRGPVASMDEDILIKKDYFRDDWPSRKWFRQDLRNCLQEDKGRIMTFNPNGRLASITYTNKGVAGLKTQCNYASNGLLSSFVGEGYKVEAKYSGTDADINIYAETKSYSSKVNLATADLNKAPYTNTYPFDMKCRQTLTPNGQILTSKYFYVDSVMAREISYTYNHLGLLAKEVVVDYQRDPNDPSVSTILYQYDNNNFLTRKTIKGTAINDVLTYVNNEMGDCVQLTIEHPYGNEVYTYEYEYDDWGNWIMRLQFKNGAFDCAALRTLVYRKKAGTSAADEIALTEEAQSAKKAKMSFEAEQRKEAEAAQKEAMKQQRDKEKAEAKAAKAAAREAAAAEKAAKKQAAKEAADAEKAAKMEGKQNKDQATDKVSKKKERKQGDKADKQKAPKEPKAKKAKKEPKADKQKAPKEPKATKAKKAKKAKKQQESPAMQPQHEIQTLGGDERDQKAVTREMKRRALAAEKARAKEYKQQQKARKAAEKEAEKAMKAAEKEAKKGKK